MKTEDSKTECGPNDSRSPLSTCSAIIVMGRVENTGIRTNGRIRRIDRNFVEDTESCPEAKAFVYSRDLKDMPRARSYAAAAGYQILHLPDTDDVLEVAREILLPNERDVS